MPAVLLDLEGTLFAKGEVLPGAADAVRTLRERGFGVRFLTNTDSRPPAAVAALDGAFRALRAGAERCRCAPANTRPSTPKGWSGKWIR